jgi:hypothetical protein
MKIQAILLSCFPPWGKGQPPPEISGQVWAPDRSKILANITQIPIWKLSLRGEPLPAGRQGSNPFPEQCPAPHGIQGKARKLLRLPRLRAVTRCLPQAGTSAFGHGLSPRNDFGGLPRTLLVLAMTGWDKGFWFLNRNLGIRNSLTLSDFICIIINNHERNF